MTHTHNVCFLVIWLNYLLQCVTKYVHDHRKCPQCKTEVTPDSQRMIWFEAILKTMFIDYSEVIAANKMAAHPGSEVITVATMNGDTAWVPYEANMRISYLKRHVRDELNIDERNQKLLFNEQALKVRNLSYFAFLYIAFILLNIQNLKIVLAYLCN